MGILVKGRRAGASDTATPLEVGTPPPAAGEWSGALAVALGVLLDDDPATVATPTALPHGHGPWAFEVATGSRQVAVRLAPERAELEREAAAIGLNRAHGLGCSEVLGIVELSGAPEAARWALVTDAVDQVPLPDLIGFNLHHSNTLLTGFAAHHDAIHRLPAAELTGAAVPAIDTADEVARIDRQRYPDEVAWLVDHLPDPVEPVLCHGGYQPLATFGPPPEEWDAHGGPGHGLTVVNWCAAVLADVHYDIAFTLVAFWSAPFFAPNRSERTAIKMIRNTLLNTYKQGYTACRPIDPDRVRFWQVFHALRGMARLAGAYDADGSPFAAPDRGPAPTELEPELARHVRQLTRLRPGRSGGTPR